jgi:opacity protein-like surface antigen
MKRATLILLAVWPLSAAAQQWSAGVATGPFVFGDFVRRTMLIGSEGTAEEQTATLSAATRPGLLVDIERSFGERFAIRAEGSFTRSPLALKARTGGEEIELETGDMDVATFMLPLVVRINRGGALRFHVMGGPAYAAYRIVPQEDGAGTIRVFRGTRAEWGWAVGGGVAWQWTERFAVEGQITDISTRSPFRDEDFGGIGDFETPRTHNVHTSVGLRYRF